MAESLICTTETKTTKPFDSSLFQRRIEFLPARNSFTGFSKGSSDFRLETLNPSTSDISKSPLGYQSPASAGKRKPDGGDLLEHGLDPELSFGITFRRIGAGLENLGNTCFLNSVLQCLTYTEPFAAYLQSGKHKSTCRMAGFCALCAIQNHVKRALQSTGRILAPKDLVMNLRCISRSFRNARQEDAHEYMVNLLESMHKCCLPSGVPSESTSAYEKSLVHKIFGGRLRSQVKCMQCNHCSNKFDPFLDLSLEIVKADSLQKALTHFTATEQLDGGQRQYHCDRCNQKVKALKQLTVHKAPYVLTIHLKRFGSHIPGQKIDKKVGFGPTLDLKPFVSGSYEGDLKYTLYGVLVHAGWSTHSGHYYCFVRTSSGMWHSLDDNRVVQVSEKTVLEQKAYMLFYVRDRRNVAPRKSTDDKQNGVPSGIGNKGQLTSSLTPKKAGQHGLLARELTNCSPGAPQIDKLSGGILNNHQLGKASVGRTTVKGQVIADGFPLLKECQLKSSFKALDKGPATDSGSVPEGLPQSAPSSGINSCSSLHPTSAGNVAKVSIENGEQGFQKVSSLPVSEACALPYCSGSGSSGPEKLVTDKILHKVDVVNERTLGDTPSKMVTDRKQEKTYLVRSPKELVPENDQKEGRRNPSEQPCQDAKENAPTSKEIMLAETSRQLTLGKGLVKKDALDLVHDPKKALKPKKKLMKHQTVHLGSKLFLQASLISFRKKKHKRNKLKRKDKANLGEGSKSCGLGPSTSEKTRATTLVSTRSKKSGKKKRSGGKAPQDIVDSKMNGLANLGDRIDQNNAVLATIGADEISSSVNLVVKQSDTKPSESQEKRDPSDNKSFSIFTKTLVQTTVPRWDEVDSGSSFNFGSNAAQSMSIGYVPDEWDEEYDRGKRKKVRNSKNTFGGPNLFQEVASMKVHAKKAKLEKAISGNQPFRI